MSTATETAKKVGWQLPGNGGWLYVYPGDQFDYTKIGISGIDADRWYRSKVLQEATTGNCTLQDLWFGKGADETTVWQGGTAMTSQLRLHFHVPASAQTGDVTKLKLRFRKDTSLPNPTYHQADLAVQVIALPTPGPNADATFGGLPGQSCQRQYTVPNLQHGYTVSVQSLTPLTGNLVLNALSIHGNVPGGPSSAVNAAYPMLTLQFTIPAGASIGSSARVVVKLDKGASQTWPTRHPRYLVFHIVVGMLKGKG